MAVNICAKTKFCLVDVHLKIYASQLGVLLDTSVYGQDDKDASGLFSSDVVEFLLVSLRIALRD